MYTCTCTCTCACVYDVIFLLLCLQLINSEHFIPCLMEICHVSSHTCTCIHVPVYTPWVCCVAIFPKNYASIICKGLYMCVYMYKCKHVFIPLCRCSGESCSATARSGSGTAAVMLRHRQTSQRMTTRPLIEAMFAPSWRMACSECGG